MNLSSLTILSTDDVCKRTPNKIKEKQQIECASIFWDGRATFYTDIVTVLDHTKDSGAKIEKKKKKIISRKNYKRHNAKS